MDNYLNLFDFSINNYINKNIFLISLFMNSHSLRVFALIFGLTLLAPSVSATRIYERPTRTPVRSYITTPTYQYQ